ncbi:MAG: isocitrate lyase/phosphoenolpyruvate mutase family protein [Chromatiales bacterium]|nr:isocitrate lyase/phosphoenolpyruvate mutase family protein [Chromatiales bacterium]
MLSTAEKTAMFRRLHAREGAFVIPNPWDIGSAKVLANLGFEALATTSAGYCNSIGRQDGQLTLEEQIEHCKQLATSVNVPVNADLEHCYADDPQTAAQNLCEAARTGIAGGSIEDYGGSSLYSFDHAVERVQAAVEAVRRLDFDFVVTARAENLIRGVTDLDDTIRRLQAFEAVGADVLYAPGLKTVEEIRTVADAVGKPLNILMPPVRGATLADVAAAGGKRLSVGAALYRAINAALVRAGSEMLEGGFNWMSDVTSNSDIKTLLS